MLPHPSIPRGKLLPQNKHNDSNHTPRRGIQPSLLFLICLILQDKLLIRAYGGLLIG